MGGIGMNTPPGWHKQADGRERFWDGEQWTEQFRDAEPEQTQALPVPAALPAVKPAKSSKFRPWMGYVGSGLVGLVIGTAMGGGDSTPAAAPTVKSTSTVTTSSTITAGPTPTATVTVKATETAAPPAPEAAISDGTWVVGEDIAAGTYKVVEAVPADCYWSITKSGTNGGDIIENDIPGGGKPKVTLKKGQDFTTRGCGDWALVK